MQKNLYQELFDKKFLEAQAFLFLSSSSLERMHYLSLLCQQLQGKENLLQKFTALKHSVKEVKSALLQQDLFSKNQWVYFDEIAHLSSDELSELMEITQNIPSSSILFLGASEKKPLWQKLPQKVAKFDLLNEKIYEREKRLTQYIYHQVHLAKKQISMQAIEEIFLVIGMELEAIIQQLEKLMIYVGDREKITKEDVKAICSLMKKQTLWQLSEEIVWGENPFAISLEMVEKELHLLFVFLSSLRYQAEMGLKMAALLQRNETLAPHFPKIFPKALQKKKQIASIRGKNYFQMILQTLFKLELMAKNHSYCTTTLLDSLRSKIFFSLAYEKVDSSSKSSL